MSIQTYSDRNTALRCQQQLASRGFLEYQHAAEGLPMEEMVEITSETDLIDVTDAALRSGLLPF